MVVSKRPPMYFLAWDERTGNELGDAVTRANIHPYIAWLPWMPNQGARQGSWTCKGVIDLDHEEAHVLLTKLQCKETTPLVDVSFKPKQAEFELKITGTIKVKNQHTTQQAHALDSLPVAEKLSWIHKHLRNPPPAFFSHCAEHAQSR